MSIKAWLDPRTSPKQRPSLADMAPSTRTLHQGIDEHIQKSGIPYLHPNSPTVQLDMFCSDDVVQWQESKAAFLFMGEGCWSQLPQLYARYGTHSSAQLIAQIRELEQANCAVVCDSGMQATALCFDALLGPGDHAICMRQVYNKSRGYLEWLSQRLGGSVTVVDDGDHDALAEAIRGNTKLIFAETFTNPLMRAQDPRRLGSICLEGKKRAPGLKLVLDTTIATPWGFNEPVLSHPGIDLVVASGTKALGGQDCDLWGYVATQHADCANAVMDLLALRGGILDWRRAQAILAGLEQAEALHERRCQSAAFIADFLQGHPAVAEVFHPSLDSHPDQRCIAEHYQRCGSLMSLRINDCNEAETRHFCDVLATTTVVRYGLSFDGLCSKVNHHKSVSEYFTPIPRLKQNNIDRLVRLAVGTEDPNDIAAALNWSLHCFRQCSAEDITAKRAQRLAQLRLHVPASGEQLSSDG